MAVHLNGEDFDAFLSGQENPVLIDFYRDGCVPCRRIAPLLSRAESDFGGQIAFARVSLTANPDLAERFQITAAPTLLLLWQGQELARHRGVLDRAGLAAFLEKAAVR